MKIQSRTVYPSLFALLVILSVLVRVPHLLLPPTGWRSAQTVLSAYWFLQEGISLFNYQTPLFGPPWQVPMEFPLYQAMGAFIAQSIHIDITLACRISALFFYYASAVLLYLLSNRYFDNPKISAVIFLIYLWLPYSIIFSTDTLIDYAALTFALGYLLFFILWVDKPANFFLGVVTLLFGCLGYLVKITTMAVVCVPLAFLLLRVLFPEASKKNAHFLTSILRLKDRKLFLFGIFLLLIIPVGVGLAWTAYADQVKAASPFTVWLTSENLTEWNFGTWEQRRTISLWRERLSYLGYVSFSGIFSLVGLLAVFFDQQKAKEFVVATVIGSLFTIGVFFNLYLHAYYYIAVVAFMTVITGYGLYKAFTFTYQKRPILVAVPVFLLLFTFIQGVYQQTLFSQLKADELAQWETQAAFMENVRSITPPDEYVVSVQDDWFPEPLFMAQRKGYVLTPRDEDKEICPLLASHPFTTVIGLLDDPNTQRALDCFQGYTEVMPGIYKVQNFPQ